MAVRVVGGSYWSWNPRCCRTYPKLKLATFQHRKKSSLYANIQAIQERIAKGSDEHMNKSDSKETAGGKAFKQAAKTEKKTPIKVSK